MVNKEMMQSEDIGIAVVADAKCEDEGDSDANKYIISTAPKDQRKKQTNECEDAMRCRSPRMLMSVRVRVRKVVYTVLRDDRMRDDDMYKCKECAG